MEIQTSLKTVLKRLRLSGILLSLPERIAYARKAKLSEENFLELVLQDEIDRRDQHNLTRRLEQAHFAEEQTLETFDWDAPISFDRNRVRELFGLGFIERHEDVIFMGPTGVGKTFLASAVGHGACGRATTSCSSAPIPCSNSSIKLGLTILKTSSCAACWHRSY